LINAGFRVLFDQGPGDHVNCSHQPNQVIISSTWDLEHNEPSELLHIHQFKLEGHLMFLVVLLMTNGGFKHPVLEQP
jgi:hypothetical protein